jgi:2-oxoglutarate ferredoxin oxidoreductase subunit gamma
VERVLWITGIGGQGVQLGAKTLATAAIADGLEAAMFGSYGGEMRGGPTNATVVLGDRPLTSPPTVGRAWGVLAMHHDGWGALAAKVSADGVVAIDTTVFRGEVDDSHVTVLRVPASAMAQDLGSSQAGAMVALGALARATGLVSLDSLVAATGKVLPSYRSNFAEANAIAVRAGFESVPDLLVPAWTATAMAASS